MNLKHIALTMVLAAVTLSSSTAFAQEQRAKVQVNRPLLYTGAGVLAASYGAPVIVAATSDRSADKNLFIPVAGPWLDLAQRGGCGPNSCETEAVYKTLLVTTGLAHLVGAGLVASSFVVPEQTARSIATKPIVLPTQMGKGGVGLSVMGRF